MAVVDISAVTVLNSRTYGGTADKEMIEKRVTVVLSSQGGSTNYLPAAIFGMSYIEDCSNAIISDNSLCVPCVREYNGLGVLFCPYSGSLAPTDVTGTFKITVRGSP